MPDQKITATIYPPCDHPYTQTYASGSLYFSAGDIIDTFETHVICLACGRELDEIYLEE
ncbi:MAG: hypothetical protein QMD04_10730 [Anaerolineales bacterium]|nr:hypothetical protein [Anaerolineales bacterium]